MTHRVIGCAIEVHRTLGPGLFEAVYEVCLSHELSLQGIRHRIQAPLPVVYKKVRIAFGYRADVIVENKLLLEIKSVRETTDIHRAQLMTYMRLSGIRLGLLLNFNVTPIKKGIERFVL